MSSGYGLTPDDWQADIVDPMLCRRRDGRYAAATVKITVPRQNGKNGILEIRELFGMVVLGEKFLHTAHEVKTARKAFRRILSFFENERQFPELAAMVAEIRKTNGQEAIILHNGGSIEFIARSAGSGRGFTVDVLVCDEDQDLTDEELAALLPTISAAPLGNPQVILTGTPPDPEKPEAAKGEVARRVRGDAIEKRDPNLYCVDFGVPDGPLPDVDDREIWYRCNPALGGRLSIHEVERERRLMSPEKFARERLGWWGDPTFSTGSVFGEMWAVCATDQKEPKPEAIAIAVSIDRAWSSIGAARSGKKPYLGAVQHARGTDWLVDEAKRICDKLGIPVVIDGKGPAFSLLDPLKKAGVRVIVASTEDYLQGCADLFDLVDSGRARHGNHDDLNDAVFAASKRGVGDRWAWARKSGDITMLEAVTLASWCAEHAANYDVEDSFL